VCEWRGASDASAPRVVCARKGGAVEVMEARSGTRSTATLTLSKEIVDAHAWCEGDERGTSWERMHVVAVHDDGEVGVHGIVNEYGDETWRETGTFRACGDATSSDLDARLGRLVLGGKGQGNDVVVYDVHEQKRTYKAKPPPPNWLGYRAPPWVSATCFASTSECARFFVGTGEHRFRHYDTRADKRAVLDLDVGKGVITSVASSADGYEAYVANARGMFEIVDLRAGKTRGKFKGNSGSIRQVAVHPDGAHVACAGLDQYVRVYDTATRKCVASAYAKQPLTAIVFDAHTPAFEAASVKKSSKKKKRAPDVDDDDARAEKKAKKKKKKIRERAVAVDDAAPKKKKKKKSKE
jgi:WD40 repeat protein